MWTEYNENSFQLTGDFKRSEPIIDSIGIAALYRTINISDEVLASFSKSTKMFLSFCTGNIPRVREANDLSFLDEIRTLQLGQKTSKLYDLFTTRYNDKEIFIPSGTLLGSYGTPY